MAGDVHEVVRALGIQQRPLVLGHSYGGVVATAYASHFPARGVVNIDQTLDVTPLPARMARALRGEGYEDVMAAAFTQMYGQLDPAVAEDLHVRRKVRQDVLLGMWAPLLDLGPQDLTAFMTDLMPTRRPTPYLSLHGLPVPDDYPDWLRSRVPGALVESAPAVTHYPHLADPAWFMGRLIAFDEADLR
ncbi:Pimeloyl-ACP methyl ester carboxylesterase [Micromonospora phaseoli]|uniref:Pimeloyl-ACP methyl ester carboxylesterase n=1 Tax=Micromonospora phaseoli TaxID=1144548 RepID=A0A1H7C656_9ACTN|nr:alpha/beta hydrolase [Micromonospora phaseoli]PZV92639.1 pimeloyl-ACP methyl ester carboxylesterase [Micromonospora phaseoli]GIJ76707.1 hypothetical protein Xph01_11390 [Micromonospora phaseoli]SEJ84077.1 Pimeloyl-ACP methyl ester carboxylesterase [Micromonospora phaseoli]